MNNSIKKNFLKGIKHKKEKKLRNNKLHLIFQRLFVYKIIINNNNNNPLLSSYIKTVHLHISISNYTI